MIKRVTHIKQVIDSLDKEERVIFYTGSGKELDPLPVGEIKTKSTKEIWNLIDQGLTIQITR